MNSRRGFLKTSLTAALALSSPLVLSSCIDKYAEEKGEQIVLPNGYELTGHLKDEKLDTYIICKDDELEDKSYFEGTVTHIDFVQRNEERSIDTVVQSSNGGSGVVAGDARNFLNVRNQDGIVVKMESSEGHERTMYVSENSQIPPATLLDHIQEGDEISVPTVRYIGTTDLPKFTSYKYLMIKEVDVYNTSELSKKAPNKIVEEN